MMLFLFKTNWIVLSLLAASTKARHLRSNKPRCKDVECDVNLACGPFQEVFQPRRQCCPRCRDIRPRKCRKVECSPAEMPQCNTETQALVYTKDNCCGECIEKQTRSQEDEVDCDNVDCEEPKGCLPEEMFTPEGGCCPMCPPIDCNTVDCPVPLGCLPEEMFAPEGKCCEECPKGEVTCEGIKCAEPQCNKEFQFTEPGNCCPQCKCEEFEEYDWFTGECVAISCKAGLHVCNEGEQCIPEKIFCIRTPCPQFRCEKTDCSAVTCLKPDCPKGMELFTPPGQCCPECKRDCSTVRCAKPPESCPDGGVPGVPEGECCSVCPDCSDTMCIALAECQDGSPPKTPPGECCATICPPVVNCELVLCERPPVLCDDARKPSIPEGECCATCPQSGDCEGFPCPEIAITCPGGVEPVVAPGQCCPFYCPDPCLNVLCALPECPGGEDPKTPEGKCCPECPPV